MMHVSFRPMQQWPREMTKGRKSSPFRASYDESLDFLDRELAHIGARNAVIQLATSESQIRRDGRPSFYINVNHPGVILTFEKPSSPPGRQGQRTTWQTLNFPCDAFIHWTDNLRGIALALEALRKIDRYGVTSHEEQYRGWAQLPPAEASGGYDLESAAEELVKLSTNNAEHVARVRTEKAVFDALYRIAAKRWHPDPNAGEQRPEWNRLQAAANVLSKHFGGT